MSKKCEVCHVDIPEDFNNLLCLDCYNGQVKENELEKAKNTAGIYDTSNHQNPPTGAFPASTERSAQGILDPDYKENSQADDKEQWGTNIAQFQKTGKIIWYPTRDMYEWIKDQGMKRAINHPQYPKFIWKPKIVDVGCGIGLGSNIMSQEADFVWGIDKNKKSIDFAKEAFTRVKNQIYYSSQVTFDNIDIMEDTREYMKFDFVVAIEIIEHVADARGFIEKLIQKFTKRDKNGNCHINEPTEFFISTPNRNHESISKEQPKNRFHVREYTSGEFYKFLSEYFEEVRIMNAKGEPVDNIETTNHTPILANCKYPKI